MEKITVNELFSGIGAQRKALKNIGVEHEVVGISDVDKYANQSYEAIYGNTRQYGDITKIERLDYADLWTYSFPCQDISVAGNQKGINEHTRSGLLYEVQRLLEVAKTENNLPKYLLLENVKNLVGKKFKPQFDDWISYLDELGYNTYWKVLNAKNYEIPQNRERVFGVSIRKDIIKDFQFPKEQELKVRLLDILEPEVDESYYISDEKAQKLFKQISEKEVSNTVRTGGRGSIDRHTWDLVAVKEATKKGYATAALGDSINIEQPNSKTRRGRVGKGYATQGFDGVRVYNDVAPTLRANRSGLKVFENIRIRRLTPLECWRLMGFDDEDFYKTKNSGVSNTQLYRQAGNSIVVKVLERIFENLLKE